MRSRVAADPVLLVAEGTAMMGERQVRQAAPFHGFSPEERVPAGHLPRSIDRFVGLSDIRRQLEPYYSAIGRPPVDPESMIRMLLTGYRCGIRSERRPCGELHPSRACRWFCRRGPDGAVPDHSTFSRTRHGRFRDGDLLRRPFGATVRRCMTEGVGGGRGFVVDAGMTRADAGRRKGAASREELGPRDASRAVDEHLAVLDDAAFGAAAQVAPQFLSPADPAARRTPAGRPPDGGGQWPGGLPRLPRQLPDRRGGSRRRRGRRGRHGGAPGRGRRRAGHADPHR